MKEGRAPALTRLPAEQVNRGPHVLEGGIEQAGEPHDGRLEIEGLGEELPRRHVDAEIEDGKAVAPEEHLDDVLADVVDVAFHRPEEYTPGFAADYVGLQRREDHVAHLMHDGARHDQAGNVIDALLVSLTHEPHALPALFHYSEEIVALADAAADFLQHRLFLQVGEETLSSLSG